MDTCFLVNVCAFVGNYPESRDMLIDFDQDFESEQSTGSVGNGRGFFASGKKRCSMCFQEVAAAMCRVLCCLLLP